MLQKHYAKLVYEQSQWPLQQVTTYGMTEYG